MSTIKERPILFNSAMVRAILDGRKTQTRRVIKGLGIVPGIGEVLKGSDNAREWLEYCPYGKVGDLLWVRETWGDCTKGSDITAGTHWDKPLYKADADAYGLLGHDGMGPIYAEEIRWRPSIHMPRRASRILLELKNIRVERLNDISENDAMDEGVGELCFDEVEYCEICKKIGGAIGDHKPVFIQLWQFINGPGSWDRNEWVWVIEFKQIDKE